MPFKRLLRHRPDQVGQCALSVVAMPFKLVQVVILLRTCWTQWFQLSRRSELPIPLCTVRLSPANCNSVTNSRELEAFYEIEVALSLGVCEGRQLLALMFASVFIWNPTLLPHSAVYLLTVELKFNYVSRLLEKQALDRLFCTFLGLIFLKSGISALSVDGLKCFQESSLIRQV